MKESVAEVAAKYLEDNAEALVSEWIDWVRDRVGTTTVSSLPERALRNHIPPVLQSLGRFIRFPGELARQELLNHLRLHGQIRRDQGYSLKEVLAEFDGLADIVTNRLNEFILERTDDRVAVEILTVSTGLATGLRSMSYIAMGTFDASEEERLHSMSERLEDFARTIAHELRGPLQTLQLGLDVLSDQVGESKDAVEQVEVMKAAVSRSSTLLDSLVVLAIAERARSGAHLVSIQEAVEQIIKELAERAAQQGVSVRVEEPLPEVSVERAVIGVVLANLIGNAIKYSDADKEQRHVSIEAEFIEEKNDSGFCELRVSDNGLGIPKEMLPRICQRGFRAHPDHAVGTGLGLNIVQQLLIERGGTITVESVEGEGTAVTIRIRCLAGDSAALTAERFRVDYLMGESALEQLRRDHGASPDQDSEKEEE